MSSYELHDRLAKPAAELLNRFTAYSVDMVAKTSRSISQQILVEHSFKGDYWILLTVAFLICNLSFFVVLREMNIMYIFQIHDLVTWLRHVHIAACWGLAEVFWSGRAVFMQLRCKSFRSGTGTGFWLPKVNLYLRTGWSFKRVRTLVPRQTKANITIDLNFE